MIKQLIIVRKDLDLSPGKLSAQVSHASMAFLSNWIRNHLDENGRVEGWLDNLLLSGFVEYLLKLYVKLRTKINL